MQTINELSSSEKSEPSCYQKSRSISSTEFKTNSLLANFKEHKQNNNINDNPNTNSTCTCTSRCC